MTNRNRTVVLHVADAAFILELLAGIFFVLAAIPLLRLAARNQQLPERILGITFLLMGSLEMLTIAMIWLVFFPPRIYLAWIERAEARSASAR